MVGSAGVATVSHADEQRTHTAPRPIRSRAARAVDGSALQRAVAEVTINETDLAAQRTPMPELHPLVVHFPIALFLLAPMLDVLGWIKRAEWGRQAATALMSVGAVAAVVAGTFAAPAPRAGMLALRGATELFEVHKTLGTVVMIVGPLLVLARLAAHKWAANTKPMWVALPAIGATFAVAVGFTGHFGGTMVYEHGVGTKTLPGRATADDEGADNSGNAVTNNDTGASNRNTANNDATDGNTNDNDATNSATDNATNASNASNAPTNTPPANTASNNAPPVDPSAPGHGYDNPNPYVCPMTGDELYPDELFEVEHNGKRFVLCCPECVQMFNADPDAFTAEWSR